MPWTNYGKEQTLKILHQDGTLLPASFYMALCQATPVPAAATENIGSQLDECVGDNG